MNIHLLKPENSKKFFYSSTVELVRLLISATDRDQISVRVSNNGVGPMIVDQLWFSKDGKFYATIEACLELDRRFYAQLDSDESMRKVILPYSSLTIEQEFHWFARHAERA